MVASNMPNPHSLRLLIISCSQADVQPTSRTGRRSRVYPGCLCLNHSHHTLTGILEAQSHSARRTAFPCGRDTLWTCAKTQTQLQATACQAQLQVLRHITRQSRHLHHTWRTGRMDYRRKCITAKSCSNSSSYCCNTGGSSSSSSSSAANKFLMPLHSYAWRLESCMMGGHHNFLQDCHQPDA